MSDIPKARIKLMDLASRLKHIGHTAEAQEIGNIVTDLLMRPAPIRRAPAEAKRVNSNIAVQVRLIANLNPKMSMRDIGRKVGIDGGRVSEILRGVK